MIKIIMIEVVKKDYYYTATIDVAEDYLVTCLRRSIFSS